MTTEFAANDIAWAIVISARNEEVDPCRTLTKGSRARYMALRLLLRAFPHASKKKMAMFVGYAHSSASTICAPSMEKHNQFNPEQFETLWITYMEKVQNRARVEPIALVSMAANVVIDDEKNKPYVNPTVGKRETIPEFLPVKKLQGVVQVSAPVINPKRSKAEQMLYDAVMNTGGRPAK